MKKIIPILILILLIETLNIKTKEINQNKTLKQELDTINIIEKNIEKSIDYNILGYIEIPKINLKKLIYNDSTKETLDKNYVGYIAESSKIDSIKGTTILAGHNNKYVFKNLFQLEKNDIIIIHSKIKEYTYEVKEKLEIEITDYSRFKNYQDKTLILITCTKNQNKRLLIILKLKM